MILAQAPIDHLNALLEFMFGAVLFFAFWRRGRTWVGTLMLAASCMIVFRAIAQAAIDERAVSESVQFIASEWMLLAIRVVHLAGGVPFALMLMPTEQIGGTIAALREIDAHAGLARYPQGVRTDWPMGVDHRSGGDPVDRDREGAGVSGAGEVDECEGGPHSLGYAGAAFQGHGGDVPVAGQPPEADERKHRPVAAGVSKNGQTTAKAVEDGWRLVIPMILLGGGMFLGWGWIDCESDIEMQRLVERVERLDEAAQRANLYAMKSLGTLLEQGQ